MMPYQIMKNLEKKLTDKVCNTKKLKKRTVVKIFYKFLFLIII